MGGEPQQEEEGSGSETEWKGEGGVARVLMTAVITTVRTEPGREGCIDLRKVKSASIKTLASVSTHARRHA